MGKITLFLVACVICVAVDSNQSILFSAIIYRHGDRTPIAPYPSDPWRNESLWPVHFGQLTNTGKEQHYYFGKWLQKHYLHVLSSEYQPERIRVQSTDLDRTLMSALTNLAGFYPPQGDAIWHDALIWQPIPVHTRPENTDEVLAMKKQCPAYDSELNALLSSSEYKAMLAKYKSLMYYLTIYTNTEVKDFKDINAIYDTLFIEKSNNFVLPAWTASVFGQMREPACFSFRIPTFTSKLARLKAGPLFTEIMTDMRRVFNGDETFPQKLAMYSAHDITIANLLNAMGMFDGQCPVYTAAIFFDLFVVKPDPTYYIKISYRNTTYNAEPTVLNIPKCGQICTFENFVKINYNLIIEKWEEECNHDELLRMYYIEFSLRAVFVGVVFIGCIYITIGLFGYFYPSTPRDRDVEEIYDNEIDDNDEDEGGIKVIY